MAVVGLTSITVGCAYLLAVLVASSFVDASQQGLHYYKYTVAELSSDHLNSLHANRELRQRRYLADSGESRKLEEVDDSIAEDGPGNSSAPRTGGNYMAASRDNITSNASVQVAPNGNRTSVPDSIAVTTEGRSPADSISHVVTKNTSSANTNTTPAMASNTSSIVTDISVPKFPEKISNETLAKHNVSMVQDDHHLYYNSTFITNNEEVGQAYWVQMTNRSDVQVNTMLSRSYRKAATVKLSFDFPFYGHVVRNVTIATGGFLYTGDYVHSWLAATQYIAPLMANFDTSLSPDSYVKYVDNGTAFTVQWDRVKLQDKPDSGSFTFQATLLNSGDIVFVYQNIPIIIEEINDDQHPVKVGVADAYIIDRTIFFVRRKTIYEYHRVNFDRQDIRNWTVIYLSALPTCLDGNDCFSCLAHVSSFNCKWCPEAKRCSNGMDRYRQEWLQKDCDSHCLVNVTQCVTDTSTESYLEEKATAILPSPTQSSIVGQQPQNAPEGTPNVIIHDHSESPSVSVSSVVGILFLVTLVAVASLWVLYAYRNPHTASGQFLIKYRPSQWSWKRGEARYTAATIHM